MQLKRDHGGFTLIELLVVIAIIGILSSIVLVSMRGATNRAKDARIISDMDQIRSTAEIFQGNNGTYTGLGSYADEDALATDITAQGGTYAIFIDTLAPAGENYCATALLNSTYYWCIDSLLNSYNTGITTPPPTCVAACAAAGTCKCK